jgi:hypothetical protein
MNTQIQATILAAVAKLLKPLVRLLLRHGIPFQAVSEILKQNYVEVANESFRLPGRKQTNSRIAVITGLNRKEVLRIQRLAPLDTAALDVSYNRAARVISGWLRDTAFCDENGEPATLPVEGKVGSFSALVSRYSGDMPVKAVLDELIRVGSAELTQEAVRLLAPAYVPATGSEEKLAILGSDVSDLIDTIDYNLDEDIPGSHFQLKVAYDNLSEDAVREFKRLSDRKSLQLLKQYDAWLAQHDRDQNPGLEGDGRYRAGVGIYFFEECLQHRHEEEL